MLDQGKRVEAVAFWSYCSWNILDYLNQVRSESTGNQVMHHRTESARLVTTVDGSNLF